MQTEKSDQQKFDEQVNSTGKLTLQIAAGVGILAALLMSFAALLMSNNNRPHSMAGGTHIVAAPAKTLPAAASIMIDHVTRGCHTLAVNGASPGAPSATVHLALGGILRVQNNDVMPHRLVRVGGPRASFVAAAMSHMGARSTVTFPITGTYSLTTKAGEDYAKGIQTIGPDNTLHIKVVVDAV